MNRLLFFLALKTYLHISKAPKKLKKSLPNSSSKMTNQAANLFDRYDEFLSSYHNKHLAICFPADLPIKIGYTEQAESSSKLIITLSIRVQKAAVIFGEQNA